jgi:uncharacterized protein with NRDE domain
MCLIVFAWQVIPGLSLLAAANRDEFYERPALPAHWWADHPEVYAGRDLRGNGTWLGITRNGRFAALTNVRNPQAQRVDAPSRGALVSDFLTGSDSAADYIEAVSADAGRFNGFNLLVCDGAELIWYTNAPTEDPRNGMPLPHGISGISNAFLDTPWPKVTRTKAEFASLMCQGAPADAYFDMLSDTTRPNDCRLPHTGVPLEWERTLSPVFIQSPGYGTRCSTVVQLLQDGSAQLTERLVSAEASDAPVIQEKIYGALRCVRSPRP